MEESARPVSSKEIYQAKLYLGEDVPEDERYLWVRLQHLLEGVFEFGSIGRLAEFQTSSRDETACDRVGLANLRRQRFQFICDSYRLIQTSKK